MKKIILFGSFLMAISFSSCENNDDPSSPSTENESFYKILNNGNAGVASITDAQDTEPFNVAQAIPSESGQQYPAKAPVVFFMNDKILLSSINEHTFIVKENNQQVTGTISVNEASNGYAIITFTPETAFSAGSDISINLTTGILDDGGQPMASDMEYTYTTFSEPGSDFDGNGGFENGTGGIAFFGDGNVLTGDYGCFTPFEGSSFAAISTGNALVSGETAMGGVASMMILGPFEGTASSVTFNYNFLSAEFLEYVGSEYDDSFVAVVVGENGAHAEFVNSVNIIGTNNTQCLGFPGMPDQGDEYAGFTGWTSKTIDYGSITGQVYVIFIATDVSDDIYSTIVGIDNVSFQ